jgi:hypothetical protein
MVQATIVIKGKRGIGKPLIAGMIGRLLVDAGAAVITTKGIELPAKSRELRGLVATLDWEP